MKNKIVLVSFPFDDFDGSKVRPALCLTDETGEHSHIVIAFITSKTPDEVLPYDILIQNYKSAGLKVKSYLRLHRLVTVPKSIIKRELGKLPPPISIDINKKLKQLFKIK